MERETFEGIRSTEKFLAGLVGIAAVLAVMYVSALFLFLIPAIIAFHFWLEALIESRNPALSGSPPAREPVRVKVIGATISFAAVWLAVALTVLAVTGIILALR